MAEGERMERESKEWGGVMVCCPSIKVEALETDPPPPLSLACMLP